MKRCGLGELTGMQVRVTRNSADEAQAAAMRAAMDFHAAPSPGRRRGGAASVPGSAVEGKLETH